MIRTAFVLIATLAAPAGAIAGEADGARAADTAFTLGRVQRELHQGLSQAEVVERLGSPNILTRDASGHDAWVYDRLSTEREASSGGAQIGGVGAGGAGDFAGLLGISAGRRSQKSRSTQRTLTVVIRFSAAGLVESFSWHDSRF
jgi:hypothetical protein